MVRLNLQSILSCIFIVVICAVNSYGQNPIPEFNSPEPNAVAVMQSIETPASYYTGAVNVSIPLYSFKAGGTTIPIELNYQTSGIKVAQEATWVGLGWNLTTGGKITRIVRGVEDFGRDDIPYYMDNKGYFYSPDIINIENETEYINHSYQYDTEPDLFYYSFPGYSGKFLTSPGKKGQTLDQNPLDINIEEDSIVIVDDKGIRYLFEPGTKVRSYNDSYENRINYELTIDPNKYSPDYISTWNLTNILFPNGEIVEYNYSHSFPYNYKSPVNVSVNVFTNQSRDGFTEEQLMMLDNPPGSAPNTYDYKYNFQEYSEKTLESINFPGGSINFVTTEDRNDCKGQYPAKRLTDIKIYNSFDETTPVQEWEFSYSYFNESYLGDNEEELYLRLKLDTLQKSGMPPYIFSYDESIALPRKNSPSFDHWGYYNGEPNTYIENDITYDMILPEHLPTSPNLHLLDTNSINIYPFIYFDGAIRNANENYAKAAILKQLTFPTGDTRYFTFESNKYNGDGFYDNISENIQAVCVPDVIGQSKTSEVLMNINMKQKVNFQSSFMFPPDVTIPDYSVNGFIYFQLYKRGEMDTTIFSLINSYKYYSPADNNIRWDVMLEAGTYKLELHSDGYIIPSVNADYVHMEFNLGKNITGPGLRIASVSDKQKTTHFYYEENGLTTGKLISNPRYIMFYWTGELIVDENGLAQPDLSATPTDFDIMVVRSSSSTHPVAGFSSTIGYDKVSSYSIVDHDTITTTKYFYNEQENMFTYGLPNLPNTPVHSNGLTKRVEYKSNQKLVKSQDFNYGMKAQEDIYAFRKDVAHWDTDFYLLTSEWWALNSKSDTLFEENGMVVSQESYEYNPDNHAVKKSTTTNSNGDVIKNQTLYSVDFQTTGPNNTITLVEKNMITLPYRSETLVNEKLTDGTVFYYNELGQLTNIYKLENEGTLTGFSPSELLFHTYYVPENEFTYNSAHKLVQSQKENDIPVAYYWGYNNQYPVAKIENMLSDNISVSQAQLLNNIENYTDFEDSYSYENWENLNKQIRDSFPENTRITTYAYHPLVGMTASTDVNGKSSYYGYDANGRLNEVKDNEEKILKQYEYHYAEVIPQNPSAPTNVTVTALSDTETEISWENTDSEASHNIYWANVPGGPFNGPIAVAQNETSYLHTQLTPDTPYYYMVKALKGGLESGESETVAVTTKQGRPEVSLITTITSNSSSTVNLVWSESLHATGYKVYRGTTSGNVTTLLATKGISELSFNDSGLSAGTEYFYRVDAYNNDYTTSSIVHSVFTIPPQTGLVSGVTQTCPGETKTFSVDPVNGANSYTWNLPSGYTVISGENSNSITVITGNNTGDVQVAGVNNSGVGIYRTHNVKILETPADPLITENCGSTLLEVSTTVPNVSYNWYEPVSGVDNTALSHTVLQDNTNVHLRVINTEDGCIMSKEINVHVKEMPVTPSINASLTNEQCGSTTITRNEPVDGSTWYWQTSATSTSTSNSGTTYSTTTGTAYLRALSSEGCWGSANTINVNVRQIPGAPDEPSSSGYCGSVTLNLSTPPAGENWYWQTSITGTSTSDQSGQKQFTADQTTYLRAKSTGGCWGMVRAVNVDVGEVPSDPAQPTQTKICGSTEVSLSVPSGNTWYWQTNSTNKSTSSPATTSTYSADENRYLRSRHNNSGCWSSSILVPIDVNEIPATPQIGTATPVSNSQIRITWTDQSNNETGFNIYRSAGLGLPYTSAGSTNAGITNFTDNGLEPATPYIYKVHSKKGACESEGSGIISTTTLPDLPATPGTISGQTSDICKNEVLTYSVASVSGATGYDWVIPSGWSIQSGQNTRTLTVKAGTNGGTLKVRAKNSAGASSYRTASLSIRPLPVQPGIISGLSTIGYNTVTTYSISAISGTLSYNWTVPTGVTILSGQGSTSISVRWGLHSGNITVDAVNCTGTGAQRTKYVEYSSGGGIVDPWE